MGSLQLLLSEAGCPDADQAGILSALENSGVKSAVELRERLLNDEELGDLGVPKVPWKSRLKKLATKKVSVPHTLQEVKIAEKLSGLAYLDDVRAEDFRDFQRAYKPTLLDKLKGMTGQKYVIAVLHSAEGPVLFVCFAGTHRWEDWRRNLNIPVAGSQEAGGVVHSGFLGLAQKVPFRALIRLAKRHECVKLIFGGHSLGGAVAHVAGLIAKNIWKDAFGEMAVLTIGFGAPFCVAAGTAEDVEQQRLAKDFLTVVNRDDPVPRILHLAATMSNLLTAGDALAADCSHMIQAFLKLLPLPGSVPPAAGAVLGSLTGHLHRLANSPAVHDLMGRLDVYQPFGSYLFIKTREAELVDTVALCKEKLGGAILLQNVVSPLEGLLDHDKVLMHSMPKYSAALGLASVQDRLGAGNTFASHGGPVERVPLEPVSLEGATCFVEDSQTLSVRIMGKGLDFVGADSIKVGGTVPRDMTILRTEDSYLIAKGHLLAPEQDVIAIEVHPDSGDGAKTLTGTVQRREPGPDAARNHVPFDENFFRKAMKAAWLQHRLCGDDSLIQLLQGLDTFAGEDKQYEVQSEGPQRNQRVVTNVTFRKLLEDIQEDSALHKVGEDVRAQHHIQHVLCKLVPTRGHCLQTTPQKGGQVVTVLLGLAAAAGVVYTGGLGLVGPLLGGAGSLTGGWGWGVCAVFGAAGGASFFHSRTSATYEQLLCDLHSWTGATMPLPGGGEQFTMEKELIDALGARQSEGHTIFPGPWHGSATTESQRLLERLFSAVQHIHGIKSHLAKLRVVGIAGPQKAGKSLLLSQLMMDPQLAKTGSDLINRTLRSPAYKWTSKAIIIDTPGLTSTDQALRQHYHNGAKLLGGVHIYLRPFEGPPQDVDAKTVCDILMQSHEESPRLLVCLNKVIGQLWKGTGGFYTVEELKAARDAFLSGLKGSVQQHAQKAGWMELWRGRGRVMESKCANLDVVYSDLGDPSRLADHAVPEDVRQYLNENMLTARGVADWLKDQLDHEGQDQELSQKVQRINWQAWSEAYRSERGAGPQ